MKFPLRVFSVGVVFACALAGCAQSPVGSESSAPSSAPEAPMSSEAVNSEAPSEAVSSEAASSKSVSSQLSSGASSHSAVDSKAVDRIKVKVVDIKGASVTNADVYIENTDTASQASGVTQSDGDVVLVADEDSPIVLPGEYQTTVFLLNETNQRISLQLSLRLEDENVVATLVLPIISPEEEIKQARPRIELTVVDSAGNAVPSVWAGVYRSGEMVPTGGSKELVSASKNGYTDSEGKLYVPISGSDLVPTGTYTVSAIKDGVKYEKEFEVDGEKEVAEFALHIT